MSPLYSVAKKIALNAFLMMAFILLIHVLLINYRSELHYNAAESYAAKYRWADADAEFRKAIRIDPFNSRYFLGFGDFLLLQARHMDVKAPLLKYAKKIYGRALILDPWNAGYWVKAGESDLEITGSIACFKKAIQNDPYGLDTAYTIGQIGLRAWGKLSSADKDVILGRLALCLRIAPWSSRQVYAWAWDTTKDFNILLKITPGYLHSHRRLYDFIMANNLWQFRKEESDRVEFYRLQEEPLRFERDTRADIDTLNSMKKILRKGAAPAGLTGKILKEEWRYSEKGGDFTRLQGPLYRNETIYGLVNMEEGKAVIAIQLKKLLVIKVERPQDPKYSPYVIVKLDGKIIGETFVANDEWRTYKFPIKSDGGDKVLGVSFVNDVYDPARGEDRNLVVGDVEITYDAK